MKNRLKYKLHYNQTFGYYEISYGNYYNSFCVFLDTYPNIYPHLPYPPEMSSPEPPSPIKFTLGVESSKAERV